MKAAWKARRRVVKKVVNWERYLVAQLGLVLADTKVVPMVASWVTSMVEQRAPRRALQLVVSWASLLAEQSAP